jgi:energy-converting hydrogenase Eha subunit A
VDKRLQTVFGLGFGGLLALFAMHGGALVDVLLALPEVAAAFAARMPFGAWSFFISMAVSAGLYAFLMRWLPLCSNGRRPHFAAETMAILAALLASLLQQESSAPSPLMRAVLLGLVAGLLSPWMVRGLEAVFGRRRSPRT